MLLQIIAKHAQLIENVSSKDGDRDSLAASLRQEVSRLHEALRTASGEINKVRVRLYPSVPISVSFDLSLSLSLSLLSLSLLSRSLFLSISPCDSALCPNDCTRIVGDRHYCSTQDRAPRCPRHDCSAKQRHRSAGTLA